MSTLNNDDLFLVQRGSDLFNIPSEDMSTIQDTDLLLVSRGGVNYKLEARDLDLVPPEVPVAQGSINIDDVNANRFTEEEFTITAGAQEAAKTVSTSIKPYVVGLLDFDGPDYTHGLRFDRTRRTKLIRNVSGLDTFTASVWYKCTELQNFNNIITLPGVSDPAVIRCKADGGISVAIGGTEQVSTGAGSLVKNQWTHIVVTAVSGGDATISVNGSTPLSGSGVPSLAGAVRIEISGNNNSQSQEIDGYLSEVYFVEGKVAPPETFAKDFGGTWGPLDSAVVKQNIDAVVRGQPYDSRANTDQVWSSGTVTGTPGSQGFEVLFNGSLNAPGVGGNADATSYKLDYGSSKISGITSFRYYANSVSASGAGRVTNARELKVNGIELTTDNTSANGGQADGSPGWYKVDGITEFTSIEFPATNIQVAGIEVNGRLLVDQGVWNNSQNWSDGTITGVAASSSGPWTELFDGNLASRPGPSSGNFYKIEFSPAIDTTGVTCQIYGGKGSGSGILKVNGSDYTFTNTTTQWVTIPTGNALTSLEFPAAGSANPAIIFGVRVDGALLVDSGAQWNTDQVWSNSVTSSSGGFNTGNGPESLFDADIGVGKGCDPNTDAANTVTTFVCNIPYTSKVECLSTTNVGKCSWSVNDGSYQPMVTSGVWQTVASGAGTLTSIKCTNPSTGFPNWQGIKVDGVLLVDAYKPGFGDNGFYLPFDPAAAGETYSDGVTTSQQNGAASNLFNGDITSGIYAVNNGAYNIISIPSGKVSIQAGDKLELYNVRNSNNAIIKLNGTDFSNSNGLSGVSGGIDFAGQGRWDDITAAISGGVGSLTEIQIFNNTGDNTSAVSALRINGKMLVDYSSIGVDDSGNGNHFQDQSFVTSQKVEGDFSASSALSSPIQAFNGCLTNGGVAGSSETIVFDGQSITANTMQFWYSCGAERTGTLYFGDSSTQPFTLPVANQNRLEPVDFGNIKTLTKVVLNGGTGLGLNAVYADGVILVDADIPVDTVIDTPINDYATLTSGSNGNLVGSGALTYTGESGKAYYYETNGEVVTSPTPVGNAASGIHNFGQQPFVNPRITSQDLDAGTVTIGVEKFNGSQEFSAGATVTGSADAGIANLGTLFNGDPSPVSANTNIGSANCVSGQNYGSTYPGQFPAGDYEVLVGWASGGGSLTNFTANLGGNSFPLNVQNLASGGSFAWLSVGTAASPFNGLSFNCVCNGNGNAGYYQAAVRVNGKILVDSSVYNTWNTSENWSSYGTGLVVGGTWGNLFDGVFETNKAFISPDKDGILSWTAPNPIPISSSLEFFGRLESSVPEDRKLVVTYVDNSGNESTETISGTLSNTTFLTYSFSQAAGKSLKSFTFQGNAGTPQSNQLYGGITIDGKILVDSGTGTFDTLFERLTVATTSRLYAVLDADLNITDLQEADPGFTLVNSPATVTFPATLPTGNAPDVELPEGTSFGSEILVSNNEGSDTTTLSPVTPT